MDEVWVQMCEADGLDPARRLAARQAILASEQALDCTVYRPDADDPDADEEDLGDARVLFSGPFEAPAGWSEEECEEYFDGADPAQFVCALIECEAAPASKGYFVADVGDYVAVMEVGAVQMYYVHDYLEDHDGRSCVLIREETELD